MSSRLDTRPRRIGVVLKRAPPEFVGGVERFSHSLAQAFAALGAEAVLVAGTATAHAGRDVLEGEHAGVRTLRLPELPQERDPFLQARPRLRDSALELLSGCDEVHVQQHDALSADLPPALAANVRVSLWLHDHGTNCARSFRHAPPPGSACPAAEDVDVCARCLGRESRQAKLTRLRAALAERGEHARAALRAAHRLYAPSAAHARALLLLHPGCDVQVCEPGVHPAYLRPLERRPDPARLRVLHAGNHGLEKGTLDLAAALQRAAPGASTLVLAGRATLPDLPARLAHTAPDVALEVHGPYEPEDLARLAAGCDLAAHPSRLAESHGLAVAECAALGLPQLVSDAGALPERVGGEPACIVPAGDVPLLAARLADHLEAKRRGEMRRAAGPLPRSVLDTARELLR